jgi:hypothetical protein
METGWLGISRLEAGAGAMKTLVIILCIVSVSSLRARGQTNWPPSTEQRPAMVETLVCIRHGEKPRGGLGQLTCRGLNRALALPKVLLAKYAKPQFVFAPNPTQKSDVNSYYYIRPLMTIEPTAIQCGLPVNTKFGYLEINGLEAELRKPAYQNTTVYIAWEHFLLDMFAKDVVKNNGGDATRVPGWPDSDFDSIFVIRITRDGSRQSVTFTVDHENLNDLSDVCP